MNHKDVVKFSFAELNFPAKVIRVIRHYGKWVILLLLFLGITVENIPHQFFDWGGDSAQYIIVAESIAQGKGIRMLNYPGDPFCTLYPPVFPLLLSSVTYFFGRNFHLMYSLIALLGFSSLFFLYNLFKKYSTAGMSFLVILFVSVNWSYLMYSTKLIRSEIPYLFFSSFTLWMLACYMDKSSYFNKEGFFFLAGLVLSYFTRNIGITLFFGAMSALQFTTIKTKWKKSIFAGSIFILIFIGWNIFKFLYKAYVIDLFKLLFYIDIYAPHKGMLYDNPSYIFLRFINGAEYYSIIITKIIFSQLINKGVVFREVSPIIIMGLIFLGLWHKFRENKSCAFHYYFIFYFFLIVFWPAKEDVRFVVPIVPLLIFYFFAGIEKFFKLFPRKIYFGITAISIAILFSFNILSLPRYFNFSSQMTPQTVKNFFYLNNWIQNNLSDKDLILSRKPTLTYFYTSHKSVIYPYDSDPDKVWKDILNNKVRYIIIDEFSKETYNYLLPALYKYRDRIKLLYRVDNTLLFEIKEKDRG